FFKGEENKLNLTEIIKTQKQKRANHATIEGTVDSKINDIKSASDNGANNGSAANNANSVSEDSKSDNGANNGSK
ncbi:MAG: hypothetical protein RR374_07130, partial [Clostridia bacterium]